MEIHIGVSVAGNWIARTKIYKKDKYIVLRSLPPRSHRLEDKSSWA